MERIVARICRSGIVPAALPLFLAGVASADEVTDWHEHMLATLAKGAVNPTVSTREAALVSAAVFDAVNGIERKFEPIHVAPAAPRGASKRVAAVQAAYAVLVARFPSQVGDLDDFRAASLAAIGDAKGESAKRGMIWGQQVADEILAWRSTDGFTPAPPAYNGYPDIIGKWRPTPTAFASGVAPQFATMEPWGMLAPDQFLPPGPPALDSEQYAEDFNEVKLMGSATSAARTADQADACRFWAANSATFVFDSLAIDLSGRAGYDLCQNAHLLARLNLTVADAIIACWNAKYHYEFWRPFSAIRLADLDGNDDTAQDATWTTLITTPAHPEYPSGHSSASGSAVAVLTDVFGDDVEFTVHGQADPTWERSFTSLSEAISEVADARIFAGIHFRTACEDAVEMGRQIAGYIAENLFGRVHGEGE
jgi:hypothetical protein